MMPYYYTDTWTDEQLEKLIKRIKKHYSKSVKELESLIDDFYNGTKYTGKNGNQVRGKSLKQREAEYRALVEAGKRTQEDFKQWRLNQLGRGKRFEAMRDEIAQRMTDANETAMRMINDAMPSIYALNRNYEAFRIEKAVGNANFKLFDEATIRRLLVQAPDVMPSYPLARAIKRGIDIAYGQRQITAAVTSSILRGNDIFQLSKDIMDRLGSSDFVMAVRAARTATTAAQNGGRQDSYKAAEEMGINMKKQWVATLDNRTRHSHAMLDGVKVETDAVFPNGCAYPGDPDGDAAEVYNCRCTMIAAIDGHEYQGERRAIDPETGEVELIENMTYQEWVSMKDKDGTFEPINMDFMAQFKPEISEETTDDVFNVFTTVPIKERKIKNSHFDMYATPDVCENNLKAIKATERNLLEVNALVGDDVKFPKIVLLDIGMFTQYDAIASYDRSTDTMYVNSKYNTREAITQYLKRENKFSSTSYKAPYLHELGHKFYYDVIDNLAISNKTGYNEAKAIVDAIVGKKAIDELSKISQYAVDNYPDVTEVFAEAYASEKKKDISAWIISELRKLK